MSTPMTPSSPAQDDALPPAGSGAGPDQGDLPGPTPAGAGTFWHGRSGLIMPVVIVGFSLYILIGVATMDVGDADFPGPQFFPGILGVLGLVLAGIIAAGILRRPEHPENSSGRSWRFHSDFTALGWTVGGFLAFAVLLPWLGWILTGGLLFWSVARGFGSRRPLFDILVGLFMSSVAYLGFSVALGLNLPSGILGGGF
ncbi:tripartite tricarboxylate transporter TctB family protein [Nesterenkonia sandarakina]|uniref:Putative tricarboxylic transport membrane protein n=1 Tax=Nesterenkonia sandarakina TaxID=272918 RepID=A0A2T0YQL8_9MICC|nr:tripartite tricarboxylate transporter TctB family protein [Nesterenkonia sandarakina]PRZ17702.1 putative tricarboxylic transport membrane protein [Nesterenkonia sandarakina]